MSLALALSFARLVSNDVGQEVDLSQHWTAERITLQVMTGDAAPDGLFAAVQRAAAAWNQVGAGPAIDVVLADDANDGPVDGAADELIAVDDVNRIGVLPGAWPYPSRAGAATVAWTSVATQEIFEVDVALNPTFDFGDATADAFDLQSALTHELGHVLGLPDLMEQPEATMFPAIPQGETSKRDLSDIDVEALIATYQDVQLKAEADPVQAIEPAPPADEELQARGCSQGGLPAAASALALALFALRPRRRARQGLSPTSGSPSSWPRAARIRSPKQRALTARKWRRPPTELLRGHADADPEHGART